MPNGNKRAFWLASPQIVMAKNDRSTEINKLSKHIYSMENLCSLPLSPSSQIIHFNHVAFPYRKYSPIKWYDQMVFGQSQLKAEHQVNYSKMC